MIELPDPCFGGWSLVSTSSYSEGDLERKGTVHIVRDTTDRRTAEEKYRMLFEQIQEGVFISTPEGRLLECNDAFARMLGYSGADEIKSLDIAGQLYADRDKRREFMEEIEEKSFVRAYEVELRRKDGSPLIALETSVATRDEDGRIVRYQGFLLDITEKKRAENEIRRRNRELFALNAIATATSQSLELTEVLEVTLRHAVELFNADTGAVYLVDPDTRIFHRAVGFGHRSELGRNRSELRFPDDFWELIQRSETQVITHLHSQHLPQVVHDFVNAEDLKAWIWTVLWSKERVVGFMGISSRTAREYSITDEGLMVAIGRQLATTVEKVRLYEETRRAYDDLRLAQEQLLQSEKMSAIGQLISGVAHELNNPLTAIMGYSQLLEGEQLDPRVRDFVDKIHKQALRTHKIVQNLLSFARQRKPEKSAVDIRRVVEDTLALRDYDLKLNNIVVEREFQPDMPLVVVDAHQIEQVFLNIVNNAVDAMLEIAKQGSLQVRVYAHDDMVCAEFRDSGPGMKDPNRVFDPFYTTKGVGKGTGLGLSICYGIVKEHGGQVKASNHPDGGAIFQIYLPMGAEAADTSLKPRVATVHSISGRVLLVDDEDAVLDFEREVLSSAGADVVAVTSGQSAIDLLQTEDFDALVIDGKMPGMDGPELYHWIAQNHPGLERRVLLSVSDISDSELRKFIRDHGVRCIVKPFQVPDLLSMMRRILERGRAVSAN
jgi:two-component system NtrC family sensor kinase